MKTYEFNGEWYVNAQPLWMRVLRWVVWFGGCEQAVHDAAGLRYRYRPWHALRQARRAHRTASWRFVIYRSLCPLGVCGNRLTFNSFGFKIAIPRGHFCVSWPSAEGRSWRVYWGPNATPSSATWWLMGAPVRAAQTTGTTKGAAAAERARINQEPYAPPSH